MLHIGASIPKAQKLGGLKSQALAEFFDVATATISNWMNEHEEFLDAIKRGRIQADGEIAHALYHRAKGYSHKAVKIFADVKSGEEKIIEYVEHYPPDTAAAFIWLKNRAGWKDKQELTGADGKDLVPVMNETEIARRIAFVLQQGANQQEQK
jgi:hypothetical protein